MAIAHIADHVDVTYHLLSEINPKQGLKVAEKPGDKGETVPFSAETQLALTRLQTYLGESSEQVTPRFAMHDGKAVLQDVEVGDAFRNAEAARKLGIENDTRMAKQDVAKLLSRLSTSSQSRA